MSAVLGQMRPLEEILRSISSSDTAATASDDSSPTIQLTTIHIKTSDGNQYLRSVLIDDAAATATPEIIERDLKYYYGTLLGFEGCEVAIQQRPVPSTFTLGLIGATANEPPKSFPSHDLLLPAMDPNSQSKLAKFNKLIDSVCEMERMRAELGVGILDSAKAPAAEPDDTFFDAAISNMMNRKRSKYDEWLSDLVRSIEREIPEDHEAINAFDNRKYIAAYVITPALTSEREAHGCRVLYNQDVGDYWNDRLGTELFPDLVVCRRLSTYSWRFRGEASMGLARTTIAWWMTAVGGAAGDLSGWHPTADKELVRLLAPFADVGAGPTFRMSEEEAGYETETNPLFGILEILERDHVRSSHTYTNIIVPTKFQWEKFVRIIARMNGLSTERITTYWGRANAVIEKWVRESQGLLIEVGRPAPVPQWTELWEVIFYTESRRLKMSDRLTMFLQTLDANNPIVGLTLKTAERANITSMWLRLFYERELEFEQGSRVLLGQLSEIIRTWCGKYLNSEISASVLKNHNIEAFLTGLGYISVASTRGPKMVIGLRCKNLDVHFENLYFQNRDDLTRQLSEEPAKQKALPAPASTAIKRRQQRRAVGPLDFNFTGKKISDHLDAAGQMVVARTQAELEAQSKIVVPRKYDNPNALRHPKQKPTKVAKPFVPPLETKTVAATTAPTPDVIHLGTI